jgi:hypothetical protein
MTVFGDRTASWLVAVYVAVILAAAAVVARPSLSPLPLLLLALFAYVRLRPPRRIIRFLLHLYVFIILPVLYEPVMSAWLSPVLSLPLLVLLDADLRGLAALHVFEGGSFRRRPTRTLIGVASAAVVFLIIAGALGKTGIMIACAFLGGYVAFLLMRVLRATPVIPIEASIVEHRVVADNGIDFSVHLESRSSVAQWLCLVSPHAWVRLSPARMALGDGESELHVSLIPPLSGPSTVRLTGLILDRWGLLQQEIELDIARLRVIPRATYAAWLARKYLAESGTGGSVSTALSQITSRRWMVSRGGIEYYGNRLYQPGDPMHSIDWKRTLKLDKFVVKEFDLPQATVAVLLVNVTVGSDVEADRLAYAWLTSAITLAREGIPTMLGTYNHRGVLVVSGFLSPRGIVARSLALSASIETRAPDRRYLQAPDLARARANSRRLRLIGSESADRLADLLDLEFVGVRHAAAGNPATAALARAMREAGSRPTFLFLSARNHDDEALEVARYGLAERGYGLADIPLTASPLRPASQYAGT